MAELPRGTVTFVFTDIEGSTRLLHSLGARYEEVLASHRKLLREPFRFHGGVEVDTQGDALFYAYAKAHDAINAAVEAQQALASNDFGDGVELRVRMGIHTGEPTVTEEGYVGPDVHLGARICSAAWGAQIVVSSASAGLLSSGLEDITLRSLGDHTLKDIEERVKLFQVVAPGLTEDFPALRTKGTHPTNLPPQLASLIGREQDLSALTELLDSQQTSVITLVGPGGTGKTSLAAALGAQLLSTFPDGVFFVDLSALTDPSLVIPALAHTLALKETPGRTLQESLAAHLSAKDMLVILDNFEQVIEAAPEVSALLAKAPSLKLLITSREALRIQGERVVSLAPLELPSTEHDDVDEIARSAAVALFLERARAVKQDFTLASDNAAEVAAICRRLDGLPLALELAAARINLLSPLALLARLDHGLKLLTSGRRDAAQRQKTLKGAIAWSYELLSPDEQMLFCRLGVFAGGWSLEAAEQVCDRGDLDLDVLDGLASLVDKSLVRTAGEQERFSMLETIREFALEKLEESGEAGEVRRVHAEWFAELARTTYPGFRGGQQLPALKRLQIEDSNVKNVLEWAVTNEPPLALRLTSDVWRMWWLRGQLTQARQWLDRTTKSQSDDGASLAKALRGLGVVARGQGDLRVARQATERSAALYRRFNDELGLAGSLGTLADVAVGQGDFRSARGFAEESRDLYAKSRDVIGVAVSIGNLGYIALLEKRFEDSLTLSQDSLRIHEEQNDEEGIGVATLNIGYALLARGRPDEAMSMLERAQDIARELGYAELMWGALVGLASLARRQNDLERAASLLRGARRTRDAAMISPEPFERELYEQTRLEVASVLGANQSQATDDECSDSRPLPD